MKFKPHSQKTILQPGRAIVNGYTLIAAVYCAFSAVLFYYIVQHLFLAIIHLMALFVISVNYLILIQTKNFRRATTIILTTGTVVVVSLFATGGWADTGYLWPFAYLPFVFFLADRTIILYWVAALFAGCLLVVLFHFTGLITVPYSPVALGNYFAALIVLTLCIFLFQKATVKREEFLSYTETLLEAAPDAVIIIDASGNIVKWNPKSAALFGWTGEEVCGKLLSEIIIPHRYREAHEKGLKYFLKTGEGPVLGKTIEIQALKKNKDEFDVALSISPTLINGKHLFIGFVRDITQRKKAEEEIKESKQLFSNLFYRSPIMKCITDAFTGKFIEVNDAFAIFAGYNKEEMIDKTSAGLNLLALPEERNQLIKKIRESGYIRNYETQITDKNGEPRWLSTNIDLINLKGKDCLLTAAIDITTRKETEEEIRQLNTGLEERIAERTEELYKSEKKYRNLFENNPMPMWVLDITTFRFLDVNEAAILHYGYSREEFLTMTAFDIRPEEEKDRYKNANHDSNIYPADYNRGTWKHLKKNGTVISVEIIVHPIIFGIKAARLILSNDITQKIKAEEQLQKLHEELEQKVLDRTAELQAAIKELESFTYSVSHDLRSPLRIIDGYADILLSDFNDKLDKEGTRVLDIIKLNARRMGQLIDDLLNLSQTGRKELVLHLTDMNRLVSTVVDEQLFLAGNAATIKIEHLEPAQCDTGLLRQVWVNLISNALKYSGKVKKPEIQISSFRNETEIVYAIKDNGVGFKMEYAGKLFGVFQRLHKMTEFEGTGIGLALASRIITKHKGKIWAESEPDKGAVFYFSLPSYIHS